METQLSICALRSSSKGNSVIVLNDKTKILVDCGISGKVLESCLAERGISPSEIDAMVITHEHSDHIKGAGIFSRKYNIPVYANAATWKAMQGYIGSIQGENIRTFITGNAFEVGGVAVKPFEIPHDAAEPVGFAFESGAGSVAVVTDIGTVTETMKRETKNCSAVMIEANYDLNMLEIGRYPYALKQRIKSDSGHLCNDDAGAFACMLARSGAKEIILGHLSAENNYPELAYQTVKLALETDGAIVGGDVKLYVMHRDETGIICSGKCVSA